MALGLGDRHPQGQPGRTDAGQARFDVPAVSLLELSFPTYAADAVPDWLAKIPVQKPGS